MFYTAFEERDIHRFRIFFLNYPFLSRLYELYLSIKDMEILEEFIVGFVALRSKSKAMVIAGRSVDLTTLFPGQA